MATQRSLHPRSRIRRSILRLALVLAALLAPRLTNAQVTDLKLSRPDAPDRCLRARPALTYSAAPGAPEAGDSSWAIVALLADGRANRPFLSPRHSSRSTWRIAGDTLRLRVFDGLVGWDVAAVPDSLAYRGIATYLTDVNAVGWAPPRIPVRLEPTVCPAVPLHN
jgi:hypothetical protein